MSDAFQANTNSGNNYKFFIGGFLIIAAIIYLIVSSTKASAQYFLTVNEVFSKGADYIDRDLRISGAVIGGTIDYDPESLTLTFEIAHIPGDNEEIESQGGLASALHQAVSDPDNGRLKVIYVGPLPDLLQHESQAIITGRLNHDGIFHADELLLKCPTKYEDAVPDQTEG